MPIGMAAMEAIAEPDAVAVAQEWYEPGSEMLYPSGIIWDRTDFPGGNRWYRRFGKGCFPDVRW